MHEFPEAKGGHDYIPSNIFNFFEYFKDLAKIMRKHFFMFKFKYI